MLPIFKMRSNNLRKCISYIHDKAKKEKWDTKLISPLITLLNDFNEFGGITKHFQAEFCSEGSFAERLWEIQMAAMLYNEGLPFEVCGEGKPDFYLPDQNLWIEATCPKPFNIPREYLSLPEKNRTGTTFRVPTHEILLRWTTAIDSKKNKAETYRNSGIIGEDSPFIIAVSGSQLGYIRHFQMEGASNYPYPVEIGYGFGELTVAFNDNPEHDRFLNSFRLEVKNQNEALVSTALFNREDYKIISALVGANVGLKDVLLEQNKRFVIAYNQNAKNPVPQGLFKEMEEYVLA